MPRVKHHIEKDNYHESIYYTCANILEGYSNVRGSLTTIIYYLREFANIFARTEYDLVESFNKENSHYRKSGVFDATNRFIEDLKEFFFSSEDFRVIRYFSKTLKSLDKILNPKKREKFVKEKPLPQQVHAEMVPFPQLRRNYKDNGVMGNFKNYYRLVSDIVEDINNLEGWNDLSNYLNSNSDLEALSKDKEITFLSYAFKDNIYALFLYDYFRMNNGFLYVDTLFGKDYKGDGAKIKASLSPWINKASQILFLHSIKSDQGAKGLSSWCSWELGEAYSQRDKKFYKVVVAGIIKNHPIIDDSFLELKEVKDGIIIPKHK